MSTRTIRLESGSEIFTGLMPDGKWRTFAGNREYEAAYRREKEREAADVMKSALFGAGCLLAQALLCAAFMQ